jgi:hypothetical protein
LPCRLSCCLSHGRRCSRRRGNRLGQAAGEVPEGRSTSSWASRTERPSAGPVSPASDSRQSRRSGLAARSFTRRQLWPTQIRLMTRPCLWLYCLKHLSAAEYWAEQAGSYGSFDLSKKVRKQEERKTGARNPAKMTVCVILTGTQMTWQHSESTESSQNDRGRHQPRRWRKSGCWPVAPR